MKITTAGPNVSALNELAYEPNGALGPEPLEAALVVEINPWKVAAGETS
jgi:hypothetical protein